MQEKTASKPYPSQRHIPIWPIYGSNPSPPGPVLGTVDHCNGQLDQCQGQLIIARDSRSVLGTAGNHCLEQLSNQW